MENQHESRSALKVQQGIVQPESVNIQAVKRLTHSKRGMLKPEEYLEGILSGNRTILSKAITLIESSLPAHQQLAQEVIAICLPYSGKSIRIGITGVPGAGKSTFIEALGIQLTKAGRKLAVLAIDPSSTRSKGSILGDKTRMEALSVDPSAFIRPSPSAGSLGGVARKTRETIVLCEAAGFDTIFVETVGVGQSEVAVYAMVDFFLLLMLAGAGDELQGIKRGIMEMADAIIINKADGDNRQKADIAAAQVRNALHLYPVPNSGWMPVTATCSAQTAEGIAGVWQIVQNYLSFAQGNGYFPLKRREQSRQIMLDTINSFLIDKFYSSASTIALVKAIEPDLLSEKISPYAAAQTILDAYFSGLKKD
ncbi:MAG: methylmalonyl Co-A mutase-associated GTPase MeaB [Bacteroidota bacterium]